MMSPMNPAALLFDQWAAAGRDESMARGHWPMVCQIVERMALFPGLTCLDVGCGNGYAVRAMAHQVAPTGYAYGVDVAPRMIEQARQHPQSLENTQFQVSQAECLPFGSEQMDRLLSVEAIYYMPDPLMALREFYRVARIGATVWLMMDFYLENPYSHCWADLVEIPMHLYAEQEYRALLLQAGFHSVQANRLLNPLPLTPEERANFKPGWGYERWQDVVDFRTRVGSLLVWGQK